MLNSVILMGRIVSDPDFNTKPGKEGKQISRAFYRLAVERDYVEGEKRPVDFINCKAFGSNARYAKEYFHKGDLIILKGRLTSETDEKQDGKRAYYTGVLVEKSYLARQSRKTEAPEETTGEFIPAPLEEENFPFVPDDFEQPPISD